MSDPSADPVDPRVLSAAVASALAEDVGPGDLTTTACVPPDLAADGSLTAREAGVLSGLYVCREVFAQLDATLVFEPLLPEGAEFAADSVLARVSGRARPILTGERVALNFLQRLCGVATLTRSYARALEGTSCRLLDTRKTAPGLRAFEKAAVRAGGGANHRFALYDGYLLKDNHIIAAGGIAQALAAARAVAPPTAALEVEVQSFAQLDEALAARADVIMLDNFSPEEVREAVRRIAGRARTEASGGVSLDTLRSFADAGVDFISVGRLTHSAPTIDINLELATHDPTRR
jgi:nicotinate-nucleotide pyrophosphorylase (carboxylating)